MVDNDVEKCRGCTIKHLSDVVVSLRDTDLTPVIHNAYMCGNLAHAANHFVKYSAEIADQIRTLRLDSINNDLSLALPVEEIEQRLYKIIELVAKYRTEGAVETAPTTENVRVIKTGGGGGCRCQKK